MLSQGENRRVDTRFSMTLAVSELGDRRAVMMASNVSAGGLYCPHATPRLVGEKLLLEVDLCDGRIPLVVPARVVRSNGGLALEFHIRQPRFEMLGLRKSGLN